MQAPQNPPPASNANLPHIRPTWPPTCTGLGQGCTYGSMLTGVASPITERTGGVTSELSMGKEHIGKWPLPPFREKTLILGGCPACIRVTVVTH